MLKARAAVALCRSLAAAGVRYWVMGGWGVDALIGRQTRPHKDLDLLVLLEDLPRLRQTLDWFGFQRKLVWEESRWVDQDGSRWPTAFVAVDPDGRELDVHLISLGPDGVVSHYDNPWPFPASIDAIGRIARTRVPCVSIEAQLAMHTGYEMPTSHRNDLEKLRGLRPGAIGSSYGNTSILPDTL